MIREINSFVGLDSVKEEVKGLYARAKAAAWAKDLGHEPDKTTMHLIFEGNAGTGKTSMAEKIGRLYYELGLVDKSPEEGGFVKLTRKDLVAPYVGQTAEKTAKALEKGLGGVIFVDEAYQLAGNGSENDYGPEALTELMVQAENNRSNTVFILAGYPDLATELAAVNQGIESRFPNVLHFDDYDEEERMKILSQEMNDPDNPRHIAADDDETFDLLMDFVGAPTQGNARDVREMWSKVLGAQNRRIVDEYGDTFDTLPETERRRIYGQIIADDVRAGQKAYKKEKPSKKGVFVPLPGGKKSA